MADDGLTEILRRRVRENPASIAFAPLAEALRLAGRPKDAVRICRDGLSIYPEYLAARVTLARAFLDLDRLDEAERELEQTRSLAPGYVPAIRALVEIAHRRASDPRQRIDHPGSADRTVVDLDEYRRAVRTAEVLESWLVAIYVTRAGRRA